MILVLDVGNTNMVFGVALELNQNVNGKNSAVDEV